MMVIGKSLAFLCLLCSGRAGEEVLQGIPQMAEVMAVKQIHIRSIP